MNKEEFLKIEDLYYDEYCKYLQEKYEKPSAPYFTNNFSRVQRIARTSEGLFIHHIKEDSAIMLSNPNFAKENPFEYQLPENLVYCDYLEHLLLHVKICEDSLDHPERIKESLELVGYGGIFNFLIPDLNDIYSGYKSRTPWRRVMAEKIVNDVDTYLAIMNRFMRFYCVPLKIDLELLTASSHSEKGTWDIKNNSTLNKALSILYNRNVEFYKTYKNSKNIKQNTTKKISNFDEDKVIKALINIIIIIIIVSIIAFIIVLFT